LSKTREAAEEVRRYLQWEPRDSTARESYLVLLYQLGDDARTEQEATLLLGLRVVPTEALERCPRRIPYLERARAGTVGVVLRGSMLPRAPSGQPAAERERITSDGRSGWVIATVFQF
jgi:hypothetical protein